MNIETFIGNIKRLFKRFPAIKAEEALGEEDSSSIIKEMSNEDLRNAIESGKQFIELISMIKFHQEYLMKTAILDPTDPEYKTMDSRSLGYMLNKASVLDVMIINQLLEERNTRELQKE